jgi:hypothetical protein
MRSFIIQFMFIYITLRKQISCLIFRSAHQIAVRVVGLLCSGQEYHKHGRCEGEICFHHGNHFFVWLLDPRATANHIAYLVISSHRIPTQQEQVLEADGQNPRLFRGPLRMNSGELAPWTPTKITGRGPLHYQLSISDPTVQCLVRPRSGVRLRPEWCSTHSRRGQPLHS